MSAQNASDARQTIVKRPHGIRVMAAIDGVVLGLLPIACAVLEFLVNFTRGTFRFPFIAGVVWYSPLVFYIQNGRLIENDFDFFVGHGLASLVPGLILFIAAAWAWFGGAASRNVLIALALVANLLEAAAALTVRSLGPFPSGLIISRWVFAGLLIAANAWAFLQPAAREYYRHRSQPARAPAQVS